MAEPRQTPPRVTSTVQALLAAVINSAGQGLATTVAESGLPEESAVGLCADGLAGLAVNELLSLGLLDELPGADRLRHTARIIVAQRILCDQALLDLGLGFEQAGVQAVAIRGFGCLRKLYASEDLRPAGDIDLMVAPEHLGVALGIADRLGFEQCSTAANACLKRGPTVLEISSSPSQVLAGTSIAGELFPQLDECWQSYITGDGVICELSPVMELLMGAIHYSYKHRFSRHIWGVDMALLAESMSGEQLVETAELAVATGTGYLLMHAVNHVLQMIETEKLLLLRGRLPENDPSRIRNALFARCSQESTPTDFKYLIAFFCQKNPGFRMRVLGRILYPPDEYFIRNRLSNESPGVFRRCRHVLGIPWRILRTFCM